MPSPRPSEEQWELLTTTIELAEGLQIAFVACADEGVADTLRERLRRFCEETGRPLRAPAADQNVLDWLSEVQAEPPESGADGEHAPVLFLPLPKATWDFVLHRLNENRDNLRRDLRGVLCVVGDKELLRLAPSEAPDLWDVRARAFELDTLARPADDLTPSPVPSSTTRAVTTPRYDVFLSVSRRDLPLVAELCEKLRRDGVRVAVDEEADEREGVPAADGIAASRFVVVALSPDYEISMWPEIEALFAEQRATVLKRAVVLELRETVVPEPLRGHHSLDWSSRRAQVRAYAKLVKLIRGTKPSWWQREASIVWGSVVAMFCIVGAPTWIYIDRRADIKDCQEGRPESGLHCMNACQYYKSPHMPSCTRTGELIEDGARGQVREEERALSFYKRACDAGEAAGCTRLGRMYETGKAGLQRNSERAAEYFQRACDGGEMPGCVSLGISIDEAGLDKDSKRAVELYQRACDAGNMAGCSRLGLAFEIGQGGLNRDVNKATEILQRVCDSGNMVMCNNLGDAFSAGRGELAKDEKKAVELYERACDGGYISGCVHLAAALADGKGGLTRDQQNAASLCWRACHVGYIPVCANLGVAFATGQGGLAKNEQKAVELYQRACDGGDMFGCSYLGWAFEEEKGGITKDEKKAVELYQRACDGGAMYGCSALGRTFAEGKGGFAKDDNKAVDLYERACHGGDKFGCSRLSATLAEGKGRLTKDERGAVEICQRACDGGDMAVCNNLGIAFATGQGGVAKDKKKAVELYQRACDSGITEACTNLGSVVAGR